MRMPAINIRPAQVKDLAALSSLLEELFSIEKDFRFDEKIQRRGLERMLNNQGGIVLAAEADVSVDGMCTGQLLVSTAEGGPAVLVEDVVVRKPWRNRGVGKMLLQSICNWARQQGATRIQLLADQTNPPALAFYEHLGWQRTQLVCLRKRMS